MMNVLKNYKGAIFFYLTIIVMALIINYKVDYLDALETNESSIVAYVSE